jgi:hypothetical protein
VDVGGCCVPVEGGVEGGVDVSDLAAKWVADWPQPPSRMTKMRATKVAATLKVKEADFTFASSLYAISANIWNKSRTCHSWSTSLLAES